MKTPWEKLVHQISMTARNVDNLIEVAERVEREGYEAVKNSMPHARPGQLARMDTPLLKGRMSPSLD